MFHYNRKLDANSTFGNRDNLCCSTCAVDATDRREDTIGKDARCDRLDISGLKIHLIRNVCFRHESLQRVITLK